MFEYIHSLRSENSEKVDKDHDDIDIEHQGADNVVIVVHFDSVMLLFSANDNSVNDQIKAVEDQTKAAVKNVKCLQSY